MDTQQTKSKDSPGEERADFDTVLEQELTLLKKLRGEPADDVSGSGSTYERAHHAALAGLAFSGGGIRSATFNLGVIQSLSHYGLLSKFDYLSTVSGGGYIGGWLSALLHRKAKLQTVDENAVDAFQDCLQSHPPWYCRLGVQDTIGFQPVEHLSVRYLRRYSNYLTPRLGLSGDTLAAVSIFLRNFVVIQLALATLVACLLLGAHVSASLNPILRGSADVILRGSALLFILAIASAAWLASDRKFPFEKPAHANALVNLSVLWPLVLAAWLLVIAAQSNAFWFYIAPELRENPMRDWIAACGIGYVASWLVGYMVAYLKQRQERTALMKKNNRVSRKTATDWFTLLVAAAIAGALLGYLSFIAAGYLKTRTDTIPIDPWHAIAFGPPLILLFLSFVVTIHIMVARRAFCAGEREWFARLGGYILLYAAGWTLLFLLILYTEAFVHWLADDGLAALAAWAGSSGIGAWLARKPGNGESPYTDLLKQAIVRASPWIFVAGLAVLMAYLTHIALIQFATDVSYSPPNTYGFLNTATHTLQQLNTLDPLKTFYTLAGAVALFCLLSRQLDINLFSLHAMYSNRLARTYLGASRAGERIPNPFSGFDDKDDLLFSELQQQRPIHIINTAINMTGGDDLAWQTRRAASFAFTPQWAGYETRSSQGIQLGAYRPTESYAGGLELGCLMAISGAAASPNMGYHTSPAVAALLTAFNLRLGRWCGNPNKKKCTGYSKVWKAVSPRNAAVPIFDELTGSATARAKWVNLTDGGHFENLGVYELIRRRCRFILVTDAGSDPNYLFEDLANLLRKCWTDFGVNIYFDDFEKLRPNKDKRYSERHAIIGRIKYNDDEPHGVLVYLKSSMTGDEWPDIQQYADAHEKFPHETTADQFFDENQFEAYRHLGYKATALTIETLLSSLLVKTGDKQRIDNATTIDEIIDAILRSERATKETDSANWCPTPDNRKYCCRHFPDCPPCCQRLSTKTDKV